MSAGTQLRRPLVWLAELAGHTPLRPALTTGPRPSRPASRG
ncbi:hypothetical protein [Amycolatopsis sp. CA-126428]|nr:hypothetical protein [Amycolatopsis sp. CA-126428]